MILFPNAKINLGLRILERRPDGFHDVETVLYPVELSDILEIVPAADGVFSFESTGLAIPGERMNNLCIKAFNLLSAVYHLPAVKMHLHKAVPAGAGLGGGSSDAAFAIRMLSDLFSLGLTEERMMDFARMLGTDCAFFIMNKPMFAFGKGDQFEPVETDLSGYRIEIVTPGIHIDTAEAYAMTDTTGEKRKSGHPVRELISRPVDEWRDKLVNDFEKPVFAKYPELGKIKQELYDRGAIYASMSGSGSSIFGIFPL